MPHGGLVRSRRKPQMRKDSLGLERISSYKVLTDIALPFFFLFFIKMLQRNHETLKVQVFQTD